MKEITVFKNESYEVKELIDQDVLNRCEKIGKDIFKVLPKITFNRKKTIIGCGGACRAFSQNISS